MPATTVTTRAIKGSALTHNEMDANFNNLNAVGMYVGSTVIWWGATVPDSTWLELAGQSIAVASYPDLFTVIGYTYGGSGANMTLPDTRGLFVRGWNHGATNDPDTAARTNRGDGTVGNNVGTKQDHQLQDHEHISEKINTGGQGSGVRINANTQAGPDQVRILAPTTGNHGLETRPINIYGMYIIKARKS